MSDKPRTKREGYVCCLSCGKTSKTFILSSGSGVLSSRGTCPKCSNKAYTQNLTGLWAFMEAVAAEIAQIKLDMIEMQSDGDER